VYVLKDVEIKGLKCLFGYMNVKWEIYSIINTLKQIEKPWLLW